MGTVAGIEGRADGDEMIRLAKRTEWSDIAHLLPFLSAGDLLRIQRDYFSHWAVYIGVVEGHSHRVIHLGGADGDELGGKVAPLKEKPSAAGLLAASLGDSVAAEVRCDDVVDVVGTSQCRVDNALDLDQEPFAAHDVVERALGNLGLRKYHLLFTNCEHFAKWCRYGDKTSDQSSAVKTTALGLAGVALTGSLSVGIATGAVYLLGSSIAHKIRGRFYRQHRHRPF